MRNQKKKNRDLYEIVENENGELKRRPKLKGAWSNIYCHYKKPDYSINCKSDNRDDVIDYINKTHLVEWYTTKLLKLPEYDDEAKEYVQEIWLQILEQPDDRWKDLYKQGEAAITAFVSGLIIRNVISSTSKAYRHVRQFNSKAIHLDNQIWEEYGNDGVFNLPKNLINDEYNDMYYEEGID